MKKSQKPSAVGLRPHRIVYTGPSLDHAKLARKIARKQGCGVIYTVQETLGSNGELRHYTVIIIGKTQVILNAIGRQITEAFETL